MLDLEYSVRGFSQVDWLLCTAKPALLQLVPDLLTTLNFFFLVWLALAFGNCLRRRKLGPPLKKKNPETINPLEKEFPDYPWKSADDLCEREEDFQQVG